MSLHCYLEQSIQRKKESHDTHGCGFFAIFLPCLGTSPLGVCSTCIFNHAGWAWDVHVLFACFCFLWQLADVDFGLSSGKLRSRDMYRGEKAHSS